VYTDLGGRNTLGQKDNPVKKISLGVSGVDSEQVIDELLQESIARRNGDIRVCSGMERQKGTSSCVSSPAPSTGIEGCCC